MLAGNDKDDPDSDERRNDFSDRTVSDPSSDAAERDAEQQQQDVDVIVVHSDLFYFSRGI